MLPQQAMGERREPRARWYKNATQTSGRNGSYEIRGRAKRHERSSRDTATNLSTRPPKAGGTNVPHSGPVFVPLRSDGVFARPPCALVLSNAIVLQRVVGGLGGR